MALIAEFVGGPIDGDCRAVETKSDGEPYGWFGVAIAPPLDASKVADDDPIPPLIFRQARYRWQDGRYVYIETW